MPLVAGLLGGAGGAGAGVTGLVSDDYEMVKALHASKQYFVITSPKLIDNPIVFASQAFFELTGYSQSEVIGRNCRFLQGPKTDARMVKRIRRAVERKEEVCAVLLNYTKSGKTFWNKLYISPIHAAAGDVVNFVAVQQVIDEKVAEKMLELDRENEERLAAQAGKLGKVTMDKMCGAMDKIFLHPTFVNRAVVMRAVDVARTLAIGDSHAFQLGGQDNVFVRLSNLFLLASTHMNADFDTFKAQVDACPYPARLVDIAVLFFGKTVHLNTKAVVACAELGFAGTPETFDEKLSAAVGPMGIPREESLRVFDSARAAKVGDTVSDWFALGGGEKEEFTVKLSVLRRSEQFAMVSVRVLPPATTWKGVRNKGAMFSFRVRNFAEASSSTYNDTTKYGTKTQAAVARHKFILENWEKWTGTKPKIEDVFR
jgi:PAS domain S-box-containing protein